MKHQRNQKRVIFVLACVACLQSAQSLAVTTIIQQKEMVIDSKWKTKGRYTSEFLVETPQGAEDTKLYLDHLSAQPDKFRQLVIRVRLSDKRQLNWNPANTGLPVGSTVHVDYSVSAMFPGFEGLFADYFSIDQVRPVKQASYLVRFPEKVRFQCRIKQGEKQFELQQEADHFQWSASRVRRMDLMITTACSWEAIKDRYQSLYAKQYGKGLAPADMPFSLSALGACSSDQKLGAVMAFLKDDLAYRAHLLPEHALMPDGPSTVMKRGWGDCKDMNLLGVALLSGMGADAFVLLTGTIRDSRWAHQLPDPFIFTHALLGVYKNGTPHYYDYQVPGAEAPIEGRITLNIDPKFRPMINAPAANERHP